MLTPVFELSQDDEFVVVIIKTPYVKVWWIILWAQHERGNLQNISIVLTLRRRNTRYKNPQIVVQHCFVASFGRCFAFFHLAWSTYRATKTLVAGWRNLLRKVERGSTLSNKFWLWCSFIIKLSTCHAANLLKLRDKLRGFVSRL